MALKPLDVGDAAGMPQADRQAGEGLAARDRQTPAGRAVGVRAIAHREGLLQEALQLADPGRARMVLREVPAPSE